MPRKKLARNPLGSITPVTVKVAGRDVQRYDASKRYTKPDGSPGKKFKRCLSYSEAQAQLFNFQTDIEREHAGESGPVIHTFFELCDYFETEFIQPPVFVGDRQVSGYRQDLNTLRTYVTGYRDHFGNVDVKNINYEDLRKYSVRLATTKIKLGDKRVLPKPATVNRKLALLRRIFNVAIQLRWLDTNPFKSGKPLIVTSSEVPRERVLTFDEEQRLLAACSGPDVREFTWRGKKVTAVAETNPRTHLKPAIIFAIESGMRKKEMFSTVRSQVDLNKMVIELNARQTKALRRRFIPISDRLAAEFKTLFSGHKFAPGDLIFSGAKDFDTAFSTACRRAKITDLRFHDLRHTAATWMDEAGVSQAARLNAIGHASDRIAQRYVNPSADSLDASRVKMNEFREKQEKRRLEAAAKEAAA